MRATIVVGDRWSVDRVHRMAGCGVRCCWGRGCTDRRCRRLSRSARTARIARVTSELREDGDGDSARRAGRHGGGHRAVLLGDAGRRVLVRGAVGVAGGGRPRWLTPTYSQVNLPAGKANIHGPPATGSGRTRPWAALWAALTTTARLDQHYRAVWTRHAELTTKFCPADLCQHRNHRHSAALDDGPDTLTHHHG